VASLPNYTHYSALLETANAYFNAGLCVDITHAKALLAEILVKVVITDRAFDASEFIQNMEPVPPQSGFHPSEIGFYSVRRTQRDRTLL